MTLSVTHAHSLSLHHSACGVLPRLPRLLIDRPRLFATLNSAVMGELTAITAPPGWGKTVLLSSWLSRRRVLAEQTRELTVWMGARAGTRAEFWSSVRAALRRSRDTTLAVQPRGSPGFPGTSWHDICEELIGCGRPVLLVLDDFHLATGDVIAGELRSLVQACPSLHVVAAGRGHAALASQRTTVHAQSTEIGLPELGFTPEETAQVLALGGCPTMATEVYEQTGGWPAAVQIAARLALETADFASNARAGPAMVERLADYIWVEVCADLPPRVLEFVLETCVVDQLTLDLACALAGSADAKALMDEVASRALLVRTAPGRESYRYPGLLAAVMRRSRPPDSPAWRRQHRLAAAWYLGAGDVLQALEHARIGEDWALIADAVRTHWPMLVIDDGEAVLAALLALPDSRWRADLELKAVLTAIHHLHPRESVQARLRELWAAAVTEQSVTEQSVREQPALGDMIFAAIASMPTHRLRGAYSEAVSIGASVECRLQRDEDDAWRYPPRAIALFYLIYGECQALVGALRDGIKSATSAIELASGDDLRSIRFAALCGRSLMLTLDGRLGDARAELDMATELGTPLQWLDAPCASPLHVARALLAVESADLEIANESMARAKKLAEMHAIVAYGDAELSLATSTPAAGLEVIYALATQYAVPGVSSYPGQRPISPLVQRLLTEVQVKLLAKMGLVDEALVTLEAGQNAYAVNGGHASRPDCTNSVRALISVATGDAKAALAVLEPCLALGARHPRRTFADVLVLAALAEFQLGRTADASEHFHHAVSVAHVLGTYRPFLAPPRTSVIQLLSLSRITAPSAVARERCDALARLFSALAGTSPDDATVAVALTARERDVLVAMFADLSASEIAQRLHVSRNTIKSQMRSIYRKLDVTTRADALRRAVVIGAALEVRDRRRSRDRSRDLDG